MKDRKREFGDDDDCDDKTVLKVDICVAMNGEGMWRRLRQNLQTCLHLESVLERRHLLIDCLHSMLHQI